MARGNGPYATNTWYHCYNKTLDKRTAFQDQKDYQNFLELLYLANDTAPLRRGLLKDRGLEEISTLPREPIVSLAAFSLLPTHFHLVVQSEVEGGITTFMRKLGTAYTLYYNLRYAREGNLFLKPFSARAVPANHYESLISYIHASPTELYEPAWRSGHVVDHQFVGEHLLAYPYSSLKAHVSAQNPLRALLSQAALTRTRTIPTEELLREAREYGIIYED
jgi:putative transposase